MKNLMILIVLAGCAAPIPPEPGVTAWQSDTVRSIVAVSMAAAMLAENTPTPPSPPAPPLPGECEKCIELSGQISSLAIELDNGREAVRKLRDELAALRRRPKKIVVERPIGESIKWWSSGRDGAEEAKATGKMAFIYFSMDGCQWCVRVERECFTNQKVVETLNKNFVCIKINRRDMSSEGLKNWKIDGFPAFRAVRSDWSAWRAVEFTTPENCLNQLDSAILWGNRTMLPAEERPKSTPIKRTSYRVQAEPVYYFDGPMSYDSGGCSSGSCSSGTCGGGHGFY